MVVSCFSQLTDEMIHTSHLPSSAIGSMLVVVVVSDRLFRKQDHERELQWKIANFRKRVLLSLLMIITVVPLRVAPY